MQSEELIGDEALCFVLKLSAGALGGLRRGLAPTVAVEIVTAGRSVSESELGTAPSRKNGAR